VDAAAEDLHLPSQLERLERQLILRALQRAEGNRAQAARWLGIRRAQLYARAKALGIDSAEKPEDEC
jgi:DNA-binding NtrC family response regulator